MEYCYYELKQSPDFSLSKYSSLSETGASGVIKQHLAFWRQINQWGKLFNGCIHLIYQYDPTKQSGNRMNMVIRFDSPTQESADSIRQIMKASVLQPYYDLLTEADENCINNKVYEYSVNLKKKEYFISSDKNSERFYTVSEWKMNDEARLYSMLRLMEISDTASAYCVDIYPIDYEETLEKSLEYIMPHLRALNTYKVDKTESSVSTNTKDESAKKALDFYENLTEEISTTPHFFVNIQVLSDKEFVCKQILDSAASEALSKGTYTLISQKYRGTVLSLINEEDPAVFSDSNAPESMMDLPHMFTLEQLSPFAMMPVLFQGEDIEMMKETSPKIENGMLIGTDFREHNISVPWKNLSKHAFMAGMPGSGKTNTMMYLISNIHNHNIPVLIFEPAKKEYRSLLANPEMKDISLFSPCANSMFPLHINPFRFPKGMKLADHINRLLDVFTGTFQLDPPMPMLLTEGIQLIYERLGWLPGMQNEGKLPYPTMSQLYSQIEKLFDKYKYADDIRNNLQSVLQVRIGSLLSREMGDIFDVEDSTFSEEEWLEKSAVIELAALGSGPSNFLILLLLTIIRETLDTKAYEPEKFSGGPRHAIFLEEAHNLIANKSVQENGSIDSKISATAYIVKMLAEVRSLGEAIIIADQLPTSMAPEVIKNTSLKFGLRLTSQDERELLGSSMSADCVQMEKMGVFTPGKCLVCYEGLLKPFELQIPKYKNDSVLNDDDIRKLSYSRPVYYYSILRSAEIMAQKFSKFREELAIEKENLTNKILSLSKIVNKCSCDIAGMSDDEMLNTTDEICELEKAQLQIKNKFEELFEKSYRLLADMSVYMTVGNEMNYCLKKEWRDFYTAEELQQAESVNEKWRYIINSALKSVTSLIKKLLELCDLYYAKSDDVPLYSKAKEICKLRLDIINSRYNKK